ncbi:hypothetical protein NMY22_g12898 [Coprinellus aureogranulatus]|nr:hypothetical protein NMY22_g12898 [Coprinellus aureogranulatus]
MSDLLLYRRPPSEVLQPSPYLPDDIEHQPTNGLHCQPTNLPSFPGLSARLPFLSWAVFDQAPHALARSTLLITAFGASCSQCLRAVPPQDR